MLKIILGLAVLCLEVIAYTDWRLTGELCESALSKNYASIYAAKARYGEVVAGGSIKLDEEKNRIVWTNNTPNSEQFPGSGRLYSGMPYFGCTGGQSTAYLFFYGCGNTTSDIDKTVPLVVDGTPVQEAQWPWHVAIYRTQNVNFVYICGGTLINRKRIITAAHCTTVRGRRPVRAVDPASLTIYLGRHNLVQIQNGWQIKLVKSVVVHRDFNPKTLSNDLSLLELSEYVEFTKWVNPACLWEDERKDLSNIVGKEGTVIGFGNDGSGELKQVKMPVVSQETCIRSKPEFYAKATSDKTLCAGFRDGRSACNGDSGGGMFFNEGGFWYIRGVVSVTVAKDDEPVCDPSQYVVFTDLAQYLPWIREYTYKDHDFRTFVFDELNNFKIF